MTTITTIHIRRLSIALISLLWISTLVGCGSHIEKQSGYFLRADGSKTESLNFELAYTQSMRSVGLMYRRSLGKNDGMLFIFPDSAPRQFWMKNTDLSLDIIFLNTNFQIGNIEKDTPPYSENPILSRTPSEYVVELNAGRANELRLSNGDRLIVEGHLPKAS